VYALAQEAGYYSRLADEYRTRRDHIIETLESTGFKCFTPHGAYYVMTDISAFKYVDDTSFVRHLITHLGVAAVPGSSFFAHTNLGSHFVRFCFCKKYETLELARQQ
jgi:aminotransferase